MKEQTLLLRLMHLSRKEISLILILLSIAAVRFLFFLPRAPVYDDVIGKKVTFEGVVFNPPDVRINSKRITINQKGQDTNILAVIPRTFDVAYGDLVRVTGVLETPENFITNTGKEFNYERYLANQNIYFIVKNADIEVIKHDRGSKFKSVLYRIRDRFMNNINQVINPPESDLANGLLLGARGGFDADMKNEFISTGTIHIIALSGYNITIVAEGVMKVLGLILAQTLSIIFGVIVIVLFIIMAGTSATAVRAGIMASVALFARMTGRTYDAGRALVIAALVMIAYDPRVVTDISFQLSFVATFGVLFVTSKVIGWVKFLPMKFGFREMVATTIAATITVLPILLYSTGVLSIVSLPANILILPFIPLTMMLVFISGIVGFISSFMAIPFAYLSHLILKYILAIIHFFASLPFASLTIQSFPLVLTIILYGLMLWWVFKKKLT